MGKHLLKRKKISDNNLKINKNKADGSLIEKLGDS
jgi:hypothetical protein